MVKVCVFWLTVDSGATHTLIKDRPNLAIRPTDVKLCSMTGHQMPIVGSTRIDIRKKKLKCAADMISVDGILGNNFFKANRCTIDFPMNHLQIGKAHVKIETDISLTKEKACAMNKISGEKPTSLFSFSNEVFLAVVEEASTINNFHELIFVKMKNMKPDGELPMPGRLVVLHCLVERQCKTKNGKAPLMIASEIANLSNSSDSNVIPVKVKVVLNKGRVLTSASYAPPEFEASLEKSRPLPPESVNAISKVTQSDSPLSS